MNAIELLKMQLKSAHETMEATMADVDDAAAHFSETGKALPVGAAYAHAVLAEDMIVSTMLANKPMLATDAAEVGVSALMPSMAEWEKHDEWTRTVKIDLDKFRAFAKKIYAASDEYIASLKEEDLDKELEIPGMGKKMLADVVSNFVVMHMANLAGEVSAAKGMQGLKGYPW